MVSIASLEENDNSLDRFLLPISSALTHWPAVQLNDTLLYYLRQGQPVMLSNLPKPGWVRLMHPTGGFVGIGEVQGDGKVAPRRMLINTDA